jgi:light-regulated signal transduction histidine kinase (bacteriophytochrome)
MILNYSITILALVVSLLTWMAKLRWSKEFKEAKEAEIKAKTAQLETLNEKVKIYESIVSQQLIEYSKNTIKELEQLVIKTEKSKQDEINKLILELKKNEEDYKNNIDGITKDVRTSLNTMVGFSHLMSSSGIDDIKKNEYSERIMEAAYRIIKLFELYELDEDINNE